MGTPKPKKGKVVRLTPDLVNLVAESQREGESIPAVIRRLLNITGEICYVLPSDIHETIESARGIAVLRAVRSKTGKIERPLAVKANR
jgi:hypothetical protein